jgi:hypothetical protein
MQSHVDESGVTPDSAIEKDYPNGVGWNLDKAPDLVNAPGGFYFPGNKVLVTNSYFGGIVLGGATKDFDTKYDDASGTPLEDLTEGVYTLGSHPFWATRFSRVKPCTSTLSLYSSCSVHFFRTRITAPTRVGLWTMPRQTITGFFWTPSQGISFLKAIAWATTR